LQIMPFNKPLADHEFGSQDTDLKLSVVETYLGTFTKALRRKWPRLWYIDAFAGTGSRTVRVAAREGDLFDEPVPEQVEHRRGSARIAIEVQPAFDRIIFIEQNPRHCAALRALRSQYPGRDIDIIEGDANELIRKQFGSRGWEHTRAVMFLDPYGMTVDWETLKAIASTKAIDVWYLFSLSGLYRQAARRIDGIDPMKRAAITRMLGTDAWEAELYSAPPQGDLLATLDDPVDRQRAADVHGLELYVQRRLREIFAQVLDPLALPVARKPQRFSLFFAVSNPDPRAITLAKAARRSRAQGRKIIPSATLIFATGGFLVFSAPLLEKKCGIALIAPFGDLINPQRFHWAGARTGFSADDCPMDAPQVATTHRPDQRLERNKPDYRWHFPQIIEPP
jgi:three-Cys-motif partner protein